MPAASNGNALMHFADAVPAVHSHWAKTFTDQHILAEALAGQVRGGTGAPVEVRASLGSAVAEHPPSAGADPAPAW
jgi:hypothetical protein